MMKDLIIIVPTHNRQHYIERVAWYYSQFDCEVYICDSTPGSKKTLSTAENIHYFWCPEKNFYQKILYVINNTNAAYYALSPDDDFLKEETLIECYNAMLQDKSYSMAVGKQCFFREFFVDKNIVSYDSMNGFQNKQFNSNKLINTIRFWSNYQNILWSVYRKEALKQSFELLILQKYKSQNFIEVTLGMTVLNQGNIYVSKNGLNYREIIENEHWGSSEVIISLRNFFKYSSMRSDIYKIWKLKDGMMVNRIGILIYLVMTGKYVGKVRNMLGKLFCKQKKVDFYLDKQMTKRISSAINYVKH